QDVQKHVAQRLKRALDADLDRMAGLEGAQQGGERARDAAGRFVAGEPVPWVPQEAAAALRRARTYSRERRQELSRKRVRALEKVLKRVRSRDVNSDTKQPLDQQVLEASHRIAKRISQGSTRDLQKTLRAVRQIDPPTARRL